MKHIFTIILAIMPLITLSAKRQRTTISAPHSAAPTATATAHHDTIYTGANKMIRIAGYDKPISTSKETLHITNLTDKDTITAVTLDIKYLDTKGRQLHRRHVEIKTTIPPGETRLADFPTWDIQRSFFYINSNQPRRQATPYDISIQTISLTAKTH